MQEKCKLLTVNSSIDGNYYIHTNNVRHKLETVTSEKDIGVIFKSNLEFDLHINEKINKQSK